MGVRTVSSSVEVTSPPKMTMATGCRISLPGASAPIISGSSAKPAESAVISTGVSRSRLPRTIIRAAEGLALAQHQIDVVADLEDAVARADAAKRDEADHGRDRERLPGEPQGDDAADQGQWDVAHDDQRQHRGPVAAVEDGEDGAQRHQRQQRDEPRGLLLRLEGAFQAGGVARPAVLHALSTLRMSPTILRHVRAVGVGENDDAPARVVALDLVRAVGVDDLREGRQRNAPGRRLHHQLRKAFRGAVGIGDAQHHIVAPVAVDDLRDDAAVEQGLQRLASRAPA